MIQISQQLENAFKSDLEDAVNSDLEMLRKWLMANKLSLNVAKTEFQIIGTKQMLKKASVQQLKIHIQNIPIKQVFQCKTLGVTVVLEEQYR